MRRWHLKAPSFIRRRIEAPLLPSPLPISFYGDIDTSLGIIINEKNPLFGEKISEKVLAIPYGRGSTVGSYVIYQLSQRKIAPKAVISVKPDTMTLVGCIIADIPYVYGLPLELLDLKYKDALVRLNINNGIAILEING